MIDKVAAPERPWPADKTERWPIGRLVPYARNARTHTDDQIDQIAASIVEWGWTTPILVAEDGLIIAGHGRVLAAQKLGITEVPVMVAAGWSEAQKQAYTIADNQLTLNSDWDRDLLRIEIGDLVSAEFNLDLVGLDGDELSGIVGDGDEKEIKVQQVKTGLVTDRFWISIRGPLAEQASALHKLRGLMAELKDVEVELGTTAVD